jgi:hypothetical protein
MRAGSSCSELAVVTAVSSTLSERSVVGFDFETNDALGWRALMQKMNAKARSTSETQDCVNPSEARSCRYHTIVVPARK